MNRRSWPVVALAALFFGPLLLAILLYAGREDLGGFAQLQNPDRELITDPALIPVQPLLLGDGSQTDPAWARSRWSLIYARISPCGDDCVGALTRLHQVWLSLGGDRDRVQQILLIPAAAVPDRVPPDFLAGILDAPDGPDFLQLLGQQRLTDGGRYFVVDPLGNVILSYPDDADQSRLLKDLQRLLEVSRVG